MKSVKLVCITAALFLTGTCRSIADPAAGASTNTFAGNFYCVGGDGVFAPGRFAYHEGVTITNAIQTAGGFVRWARKSKVELIRNGKNAALVVDVSKIESGRATNVTISPGDYVYVRGPTVVRRRWPDQPRP